MRFEQAVQLLAEFEREQVSYILIGSMAMAAHGIIRATQDVDFLVSPEEANVARIKQALRSVFRDESIDEIANSDLAGPYPVIRYVSPDGDFVIDLIARLGDAFEFKGLEWEGLLVEGVTVRVATPKVLYMMKRDTLRPQDQVDAENLRARFRLEPE
jgi:hypothetical protein